MKINGKPYRTIWPHGETSVEVIDQTKLPHEFRTTMLRGVEDAVRAIKQMIVRGAPLIGATAAYGIALAMNDDPSDEALDRAHDLLLESRPTAVNLRWALKRMCDALRNHPRDQRAKLAWAEAAKIADEDVEVCRSIGEHGLKVLQNAAAKKKPGETLNVLTHCNAGWLGCVDWGTALAPIYMAYDAGIPIHVWVDETRPRNQGASLTAFELGGHGVPHTDKIAGIEARGFILGGAVAHQLSVGFVPVRKKGKLPHTVIGEDYDLEYGKDRVEIHTDAVSAGDRIILVDDLIATGGTAFAAIKLLERAGAKVIGCAFVIDLPDLGGADKIRALGKDVVSLVSFGGH